MPETKTTPRRPGCARGRRASRSLAAGSRLTLAPLDNTHPPLEFTLTGSADALSDLDRHCAAEAARIDAG